MKKIHELSIQKPQGVQTFVLDAKILDADGKETSVSVKSISAFFGWIFVKLSDGSEFTFHGFPYIIIKK